MKYLRLYAGDDVLEVLELDMLFDSLDDLRLDCIDSADILELTEVEANDAEVPDEEADADESEDAPVDATVAVDVPADTVTVTDAPPIGMMGDGTAQDTAPVAEDVPLVVAPPVADAPPADTATVTVDTPPAPAPEVSEAAAPEPKNLAEASGM